MKTGAMKVKCLISAALFALSVSCAGAEAHNPFNITVHLNPENDGEVVYLMNYDTGEKLDSVIVEGGMAVFSGDIATPTSARLLMDGNRLGTIYLEKATINVYPYERNIESDGELQARENAMTERIGLLREAYSALPDDSTSIATADSIASAYDALLWATLEENADNPLGVMLFSSLASEMSLEEMDEYLAMYPSLKKSVRVNNAREDLVKQSETTVGKKYKDFAITYNGETKRLSDYIGPDHYTIVDFWASWCGPCIKQVKVLKELYDELHDKGLNFLSVAVWDEPENTLTAIEAHQIPWDQIIDAQSIPTDLYGINGIPCIILIGPDGTILSRNQQGEQLKKEVRDALQGFESTSIAE